MSMPPRLAAAIAHALIAAPIGWIVAGVARAQAEPPGALVGAIMLDRGNLPGALIGACILFVATLIYPRKK